MVRRREKGDGSIWQEGRGWRAGVYLDGRRVTKMFKTKRDAGAWIREMQQQVKGGMSYKATRLTVRNYLHEWMETHQTRLTPKTAERYKQIIRDYISPEIGRLKLHQLKAEHVERLYGKMLQQGMSARNIRWIHAVLHRSLNDAVKWGIVGYNAAHGIKLPKMPSREMNILDENEAMRLLIAAQGDRNEGIYHLAIKTGMRQGEILGLKWSDLDWARSTLVVQRQVQWVKGEGLKFSDPKTASSRRTIKLGPETIHILRKHLNDLQREEKWHKRGYLQQDLMFPTRTGRPQSGSNLLKEFRAILDKAGLKRIRFHDLRHTAASLMLNHGVPVLVASKILGHSKASTTLDIYGHLIAVMQDNVAAQMTPW